MMALNGQQINWLLDGYDLGAMKGHKKLHYEATSTAPIPPADFHRILAEKDRAIAEHDALLEEHEALLKEHKKNKHSLPGNSNYSA